ncbi:two-component system sensor histidine kinase NtrB [Chitinimonas sp. BJB300]|uniref:two-component system sensor histidine kinase NtrB n=1 Tax=Chitinimonas sp. BJB300 TaxID=1559339 RepID=UPI0011125BD9|nr:ATP-binding protein [Chitinimonas sp. BJB300]TSJ91572.1 PAS domain-containing protein [Chitinimonas sp. BJB300]
MPARKFTAPDAFWRSAKIFNLFRAAMVASLIVANWSLSPNLLFDKGDRISVNWASMAYLCLISGYTLCLRYRWPTFRLLLGIQVGSDILFIVGVMHIGGGFQSGIALMLLPYLAGAGLISRGSTTLFHAAMASIALLGQQGYQYFFDGGRASDWFQVAMVSSACFATAWLAHRLASYATESEQLAARRGNELANMAQINRLVIQDVSDGVLVLDELGVVRQFNQQAERLLGRGMVVGRTVLREFSPALARALSGWREGDSTLAPNPASNQRVRPRFMPVQVGSSATGTVVFLEDIERLQREAQQIKLAALGRLTANIAHEIRNPLSAISHAAQLLAEDADDPASKRLTQIIGDNTKRLNQMVQEVLDLNRRDRADPVDIRLHEWLTLFVAEFKEVEGIQADIVLECPQGATARFDEGQLHQVMWNLCRNGWRYCSQKDGGLSVKVGPTEDAWAIQVRDDGAGVSSEDMGKLFEPFFTTDAKGTGLGLYIAREICAGNDSVLEYVPVSLGACFRITFPSRPA